jgi:hypothetical protein
MRFGAECWQIIKGFRILDDLAESRRAQRRTTAPYLLMALALSASVVPAWSEHATVRGAGASTCDDHAQVYQAFRLSKARAGNDEVARYATASFLQYEEWIDGYILGMETSFKGGGVERDWDQVDIGKWFSDDCQEHRSDIVANAALALFKEMRGASF